MHVVNKRAQKWMFRQMSSLFQRTCYKGRCGHQSFHKKGTQGEQNEAKVALAGMELWMSVTRAGDVVEFLQVSFCQTQLVDKVSTSVGEE